MLGICVAKLSCSRVTPAEWSAALTTAVPALSVIQYQSSKSAFGSNRARNLSNRLNFSTCAAVHIVPALPSLAGRTISYMMKCPVNYRNPNAASVNCSRSRQADFRGKPRNRVLNLEMPVLGRSQETPMSGLPSEDFSPLDILFPGQGPTFDPHQYRVHRIAENTERNN